MSLHLRWVGENDLDRVAETRMLCYAPALKDLDRFKEGIRSDRRARSGDFLLAERDGQAVGTTTSLSMTMWVRGAPVSCQGVAFVGTIKTHRRGGAGSQKGVATQLMAETLRRARERREIVSALMPFRASYYEHFGYGVVETRHEWTVPLSILPQGEFDGMSFVRSPKDVNDMMECRSRMVEAGQCDIERSREAWEKYRRTIDDGYEVIDRRPDGTPQGFMYFTDAKIDGKTFLRVVDQAWVSTDEMKRQLHFLASLKDQYSGVILTLPKHVPLNWMLRETQIPHRPVEHVVPKLSPYTRMQVRILDHKRFLEALKLPTATAGRAVVAVHESEQTTSKFKLEIADGHAHVSATDSGADVECADRTWAAIACGELTASQAAHMGLLQSAGGDSVALLDVLSVGPAPFCLEYF
jgi:predicted acetyltransferase